MKAAIVTGAGSGIGKATALELSKKGYFVYLIGRNKEKLEEVALHCQSGARRYSCDLSQAAEIEKTTTDILKQQDTEIEILINNAGIFQRHSFEDRDSIAIWREQFETNLFGAVLLTQKIYSYFIGRKKGSIVNVSSTLGLRTSPGVSAYAASKAAMVSWTHSLALEGGPHQIRANCVCPGLVDTPIHSFHTAPPDVKTKTLSGLAPLQPLGRIGTAEEVAKAIAFLACDDSSWTTGSILSVDGGINLT